MRDLYLVINCGSSSLKFSMFEMPIEKELISGYIEKIGKKDCFWTINVDGNKYYDSRYLKNHTDSVNVMLEELIKHNIISSMNEIKGIGHRVLHGGEKYFDSVIIDNNVLNDIIDLTKLGPLHHPGEIAGIKAMIKSIPNCYQVAVFDTSFHQTIDKCNYIYAIPYDWYLKYGVRKYGFHGTSHKYITECMIEKLHKKDVNLIICHVGSGASVSCIKNSKCFDTSMGLTPLDGLVMGTRCGNIDPSIIKYMVDLTDMDIDSVMNSLNNESGLLGLCGKNDFRDVLELINNNSSQAILAYNIFINSIIKYIALYYFELSGCVDAIVFTAGILENNSLIRKDIINRLNGAMDIEIDSLANDLIGYGKELKEGIITTSSSKVSAYVVKTSEEVMIARDTYRLINSMGLNS